ncbi:hypothetical protein K1719_018503 [Acacia pycnantha]|nr:hypothetical protein K1719_018503 [Acacia pycnantha]
MSANQKPLKLDDDQVAELREIFRSFDRNKDGSLTQLELGSLLRSLGLKPSEDQLEALIQKADKNSNGMVEFSEFIAMVEPDLVNACSPYTEEQLRQIFRLFDRDGNGYITLCKKIKPRIDEDAFRIDDPEGSAYDYPMVLVQIPMCNEREVYEQSISVATKVEETKMPQLKEFQVEEPKLVFEARSIHRMELLHQKYSPKVKSVAKSKVMSEEEKAALKAREAASHALTAEELTEMIKEADTNGDGCINFQEFAQTITSAAFNSSWS